MVIVTTSQNAGIARSPVTGPRTRPGRLGTAAWVVAVAGLVAAVLLIGPALSSEPITTTVAAGDALEVGGLQLTASPLTSGESMVGPTLCSTVTYRNTGSAPASVDAVYDWKLRDPSGAVVSAGVFGTDSAITAGQLAAGRATGGAVCFDHAATAAGWYTLQFDPMGFSSDRGAWTDRIG